MKNWLIAPLAAFSLALLACEESNINGGDAGTNTDGGTSGQTIDVTAAITSNTTWTTGNTYVLKGQIFVKNGATLTLQPGVTVQGSPSTALIITTTGKIDAQGTPTNPIVMTSVKAPGTRLQSDWGGLILLGNATVNTGTTANNIEGLTASEDTRYGGSDDAHNCGTVKHVRIEFSGYEVATGREINGLTVGACGTGTTLDFIQIHRGSDDGVEFFGGKADIKHLVVTLADDDGLDWDFGWQGQAQFVIIQHGPTVGDKGFEADNHPSLFTGAPRSLPEIWNLTMIGGTSAGTKPTDFGMHLRRGTGAKISNAIVAHFHHLIVDVDGPDSVDMANAGDLYVNNSVFFRNGGQDLAWPNETTDNDSGFDEAAFFTGSSMNNQFVDPALTAPLNLTAPNFKPTAGSPVLTGGDTPPAPFDTTATFRGAIGATDWTAGWTAFPEN
jgi:hypothetical protein